MRTGKHASEPACFNPEPLLNPLSGPPYCMPHGIGLSATTGIGCCHAPRSSCSNQHRTHPRRQGKCAELGLQFPNEPFTCNRTNMMTHHSATAKSKKHHCKRTTIKLREALCRKNCSDVALLDQVFLQTGKGSACHTYGLVQLLPEQQ